MNNEEFCEFLKKKTQMKKNHVTFSMLSVNVYVPRVVLQKTLYQKFSCRTINIYSFLQSTRRCGTQCGVCVEDEEIFIYKMH